MDAMCQGSPVQNGSNHPDAPKDVYQILRERRESLDRVRASLDTVSQLQRRFQENTRSAAMVVEYPTKRLQDICGPNVRMISINDLSISIVLDDNQSLSIVYPSQLMLADDLKAWSKSAAPQDLSRLNITPNLRG